MCRLDDLVQEMETAPMRSKWWYLHNRLSFGHAYQDSAKFNCLFDPHHPAGRRTIEWLVRVVSGGRMLRTCTVLTALIVFILSQWVALVAMTEADFINSLLPAIVFLGGCGIKIARRMPSYLNNTQLAFLRNTGSLELLVEDT